MSGYAVNREPLPRAPEWSKDAFCRGLVKELGPEELDDLIFPANEDARVDEMIIRLCSHCTVRPECLSYAIEHRLEGNWAGTTTANRSAIRRRRSRAKCPVCRSVDTVLDAPGTDGIENLHQVCLSCGHSWLTDRIPESALLPRSVAVGPKRIAVKGRSRAVDTVHLPEAV
jgi:Zn ribbon nucleic-acid-binding protein